MQMPEIYFGVLNLRRKWNVAIGGRFDADEDPRRCVVAGDRVHGE
jgi:hypothetical protein